MSSLLSATEIRNKKSNAIKTHMLATFVIKVSDHRKCKQQTVLCIVKGAWSYCIIYKAAQLLWTISLNEKQLQTRFLTHNTTYMCSLRTTTVQKFNWLTQTHNERRQ